PDGGPARDEGPAPDEGPEPDEGPARDAGPDFGADAGGRFDCDDDLDPWQDRSDRALCSQVDIFTAADCTPARRGVVCGQLARCEPPFGDPGVIVRCCDGMAWRFVFEEPDPCGTPPPEE
ncbi:MAG: hypothetical protein H6701_13780, partial [Myxococcales bacterium]|nr:hypothetical protein [Myxococcales bacterium]